MVDPPKEIMPYIARQVHSLAFPTEITVDSGCFVAGIIEGFALSGVPIGLAYRSGINVCSWLETKNYIKLVGDDGGDDISHCEVAITPEGRRFATSHIPADDCLPDVDNPFM